MRILVLIYEYPPVGGGGGMVAHEISHGLARLGHQVHVITTHYKGLPLQEDQDGVQILRVPRQTAGHVPGQPAGHVVLCNYQESGRACATCAAGGRM